MRIDPEVKLDFKDVLFRPKRSALYSRSEVDLIRTLKMKHTAKTWTGIPICAANMDSTGTFEMARALSDHRILTAIHKHYSLEQWDAFMNEKGGNLITQYIAVSTGISNTDLDRAEEILTKYPGIEFVCIDVANGYSEGCVAAVKSARERFPSKIIIAGNVVTSEMTEELILSGADIVKVGIGAGSVCTTRKQTGVGYPQLSAVIECADAAHGLSGLIMADGGCTCPGDIAKAFGGGADFVMIGGMLAGHDEAGGTIVESDGVKYKYFYGMSSSTAMHLYAGKMAEYRSSEGKLVKIPYRGAVSIAILDILGGLRSTCTYVGAHSLRELSKRTTFVRVTQQLNEIFGVAGNGNVNLNPSLDHSTPPSPSCVPTITLPAPL